MDRQMKIEVLKVLYENYIREKENVNAATAIGFNPFLGKKCVELPSMEQYRYASGKLDGFLTALQWELEEKNNKVVVRKCFNGQKLFDFTAFN